MKTQGICKYCGQIQTVDAVDQDDANRKATLNCTCEGSDIERRRQNLHENIKAICGEQCEAYGLKVLKQDVELQIHDIAEFVLFRKIQSVTINVDNSTVKISGNSKGDVKVVRTMKNAFMAEC